MQKTEFQITLIDSSKVVSGVKGFAKRAGIILAVYLFFAGAEIYLHWYAGTQNTPMAQSLKQWYLYRDPYSGKTPNGGSMDYYLPARVIGLLLGLILARHGRIELVFWVLFNSVGIACLYPLYIGFFSNLDMDRSDSLVKSILGLTFKAITIAINCGIFAFVGRIRAGASRTLIKFSNYYASCGL